MKITSLICAAALAATSARAAGLQNYDALSEAPAHPLRQTSGLLLQSHLRSLVRPNLTLHSEDRLGVPTFLWAAPTSDGPRKAALAKLAPADAARTHLGNLAELYSLSPQAVQNAELRGVQDNGLGFVVVSFGQRVGGVPVFRTELKVLLDRQMDAVALSGYLSPDAEAAAQAPLPFSLSTRDAVARGVLDLRGEELLPGDLADARAGQDGDEWHDALPQSAANHGFTFRRPARTRRVFFQLQDHLEPATYVELDLAERGSRAPHFYSYVFSAVDGRLLFRNDLTAYDNSFSYRVWAETDSAGKPLSFQMPHDGPQGTAATPYPTATPNKLNPTFLTPSLVTLANYPFSTNDPWLLAGATETVGNNADAYADLSGTDQESSANFRATVTAPGVFDRTYDPNLASNANQNQQMAAITQLFYNVNFFHDWYYDSGFNEAAGNAQLSNYGRGGAHGKEGDPLHAEALDGANLNPPNLDNANMSTPADGSSPRMQMYMFRLSPITDVSITAPPAVARPLIVGTAAFGAQTYDVTAQVVQLTSTSDASTDACGAVTNASALAGKIALIDRGNCSFAPKVKAAQDAGAIGVVIVNNVDTPPLVLMGQSQPPTPGITIPAIDVRQVDGNTLIKPNLAAGVTMHLKQTAAGVDRDGAIDNQIVAHEWGHYISNRLIFDANGLSNKMARGLGEGWADFHAMLFTVRAEDINVAANANWAGTYGIGEYASAAFTQDTYYFGIRRYPYSTDMTKDPLTFKHIQDGTALPPYATAPISDAFINPFDKSYDPSDNSEVHNTGEIWTTMLWECYAALLRDTTGGTPRLTFAQARDRMKKYVVLAYKMTPSTPTLLEARDALLAAASSDLADYKLFLTAFAKRGAGLQAKLAADRWTPDNVGVTEDFAAPADSVALISAALDNSTTQTCGDAVGTLRAGETGKLTVTLQNLGPDPLNATVATVTAPGITFTSGTQLTFPAMAPRATATATLPVSLAATTSGAQTITLTFAVTDAAIPAPITLSTVRVVNVDELANQSATDDVESATTAWTLSSTSDTDPLDFKNATFRRVELSPTDHRWFAPDTRVGADVLLISPPLQFGSGAVSLSFKHRFNLAFGTTSAGDTAYVTGGVVELSTDNGATWTDIGGSAYTGTVFTFGGNPPPPLDGRKAFVGKSTGWSEQDPSQRITSTLNLGTTYAGKTVLVRFRLVELGFVKWGWEIDDIAFSGLANLPFQKLVGRAGAACNHQPTAHATGPATAPEKTPIQLDGSASTDPDGLPLTYAWVQQAGPPAALSDPSAQKPTFTATGLHQSATYAFALTVSNTHVTSAPSVVTIAVTHINNPPVAVAGADQSVSPGATVTLDGSASSDPDADALTYKWTQTGGATVVLATPNAAQTTFTAPSGGGQLTFQLVVNDGQVDSPASVTHVNVKKSGCGCSANGQPMSAPLIPLAMILFALRKRRRSGGL